MAPFHDHLEAVIVSSSVAIFMRRLMPLPPAIKGD